MKTWPAGGTTSRGKLTWLLASLTSGIAWAESATIINV